MMLASATHEPLSPTSKTLGNNILHTLVKHYPAFKQGWSVHIYESGGIVQVSNTLLSGKMGFVLHTAQIDPELKSVMRAGGELLERYRIATTRVVNTDSVIATLNANRAPDL